MVPNFVVTIGGREVPVNFNQGVLFNKKGEPIAPELVLCFKAFVDYCANMDARFVVRSITIQSVDMFGSKVGFVKIDADIIDADRKFVPGIALLRGGSVVILPVLNCKGIDYTVIVKQKRSPIGEYQLPECAAGMLDGSGHFTGKAAEEMKQELDIDIRVEQLIDLTELAYGNSFAGVFASPGGSDEFFRVMLYQQEVEDVSVYHARQTGLAEEGESIDTEVILLSDLWRRVPDAKSHSALTLYRELMAAELKNVSK